MVLPLEILAYIRKETALFNMNVNLVYKKMDAQQQEDPKIQKQFY